MSDTGRVYHDVALETLNWIIHISQLSNLSWIFLMNMISLPILVFQEAFDEITDVDVPILNYSSLQQLQFFVYAQNLPGTDYVSNFTWIGDTLDAAIWAVHDSQRAPLEDLLEGMLCE